jgi:hypothetical protein
MSYTPKSPFSFKDAASALMNTTSIAPPTFTIPTAPLPENVPFPSKPLGMTANSTYGMQQGDTNRFHRTAQSDILHSAINILTEGIIEERKSSCYVHVSHFFDNNLDVAAWLNKTTKDERETRYNEWLLTRKPDALRIRNSIVIHNLNDTTSLADIYMMCSRIGTVLDIYKPKDDKGYVFIDFEDSLSIAIAIREMHKTRVNDDLITVNIAKTAFTSRNDYTKKAAGSPKSSRSNSPPYICGGHDVIASCLFK